MKKPKRPVIECPECGKKFRPYKKPTKNPRRCPYCQAYLNIVVVGIDEPMPAPLLVGSRKGGAA